MSLKFANVKNVFIPDGEVVKIELDGKTLWEVERWDHVLLPANGSAEGEILALKLPVNVGDTVTIEYLLTKAQGYIYDGRNVGLQYYGTVAGGIYPMAESEIGVATTITIKPTSAGVIGISCGRNGTIGADGLDTFAADRCFGQYIKVRVKT